MRLTNWPFHIHCTSRDYLADLAKEFESENIDLVRYADDIILLAENKTMLDAGEMHLREIIKQLKLSLSNSNTKRSDF